MDNILHMVGLALKAGRLEVGEEPVGAACRARDCRLILVARDAADNSFRRVKHFADAGQCLTAEKLHVKAERAAQRRKEQQAHERNLRRGGKKHGGKS